MGLQNMKRVGLFLGLLLAVVSVSSEELSNLGSNEGLVVIAVNGMSNGRLELNGSGWFSGKDIRPQKVENDIQLLKLRAGHYYWHKLWFNESVNGGEYFALDDLRLEFDVKPGVITYPGHLNIVRHGSASRFSQLDRLSQVIRELEAKYPELLQSFPLVYTGKGRDDFLNFYRAQE